MLSIHIALGLPTALTGVGLLLITGLLGKKTLIKTVGQVSWFVLPLVAGLFVIVEGLNKTGVLAAATAWLEEQTKKSVATAAWSSGLGIAFTSNIINNLPSGLIAGNALQAATIPEVVRRAVLIGLDLGPNLSVTGSLATILWLVVLRRENEKISAFQFFKIGIVVMLPALIAAIASLWI